MVSCDGYGGLRVPDTESIVNGTLLIAERHSLRLGNRTEIGPLRGRIQLDEQFAVRFRGQVTRQLYSAQESFGSLVRTSRHTFLLFGNRAADAFPCSLHS